MEKGRKTKVIAILALVVAVVGMSLGFAAFSNILTISSSATVTPNEDDFKVVVYGIGQDIKLDGYSNSPLDSSLYNSTDLSKPNVLSSNSKFPSAQLAYIDNDLMKVSNLSVEFTEPYQQVQYYFLMKNEGKYNVYINFSDNIVNLSGGLNKRKICIADEETTKDLADEVCSSINAHTSLYYPNENNVILNSVTNSYKIVPGDFVRLKLYIIYSTDKRVDGPLTIKFGDFQGFYTTEPKGTVVNP